MHGFGAAMTDASASCSQRPSRRQAQGDHGRAVRARTEWPRAVVHAADGRRVGLLDAATTATTTRPGTSPDPELRYFSIEPAKKYVLPRVREALAINPDLLVMISPWSAPAWMKTTRSLIQGQLVPQYYPAFANYLARTVEAFGREGVPVSMLTIQNEPDFEPDSYPGMRVDSPDRAVIIGRYVGPTVQVPRAEDANPRLGS